MTAHCASSAAWAYPAAGTTKRTPATSPYSDTVPRQEAAARGTRRTHGGGQGAVHEAEVPCGAARCAKATQQGNEAHPEREQDATTVIPLGRPPGRSLQQGNCRHRKGNQAADRFLGGNETQLPNPHLHDGHRYDKYASSG